MSEASYYRATHCLTVSHRNSTNWDVTVNSVDLFPSDHTAANTEGVQSRWGNSLYKLGQAPTPWSIELIIICTGTER